MVKGKHLKEQQGFTLLEIVIILTLGTVLTLTIFLLAAGVRRSIQQNTSHNYNLLAAKQALSQITEELRYADGMAFPAYTNPTTTLSSTTFTVSGCKRVIDMEFTGGSGNSVVIRRYNNTGSTLLTSQTVGRSMITALSFSRNATATVNVSLDVKDSTKADNPTLNMSTTVRMMNVSN